MALIKCEDCKNEYSDKAKECPKCGCPTISNTITEKRKKIKPCSIEIKGDERLRPKTLWGTVLVFFSIPLVIIQMTEYGPILILAGLTMLWSYPLSFLTPKYRKMVKEREKIYEYFRRRFIILKDIPQNYSETKIINKQAITHYSTMFDIYMEAYNFNADVIVLNDSNVETKVTGRTSNNIIGKGSSGTTTSSSTFYITATLVRY